MTVNVKRGVKGFVSRPLEDRFWEKVDKRGVEDCWLWTGSNDTRYGQIWFRGKALKASRVAWELTRGPIPPGMQVCHTCDNPPCVNPSHLWLGTMSDNIRDAVCKGRVKPSGAAGWQKTKTHCKRGHPFTPENTYQQKGGRGCRACLRMRNSNRAALHQE
jgi:hypothetical protein